MPRPLDAASLRVDHRTYETTRRIPLVRKVLGLLPPETEEQSSIRPDDRLCFEMSNRHACACFDLLGLPLAEAAGIDAVEFMWPVNQYFFSESECAAALAAIPGLSQRLQDEPDAIFVDMGIITVGSAAPTPWIARVRKKRVVAILARLARMLAAAGTGQARLAYGSGSGYRRLCGLPPVPHYS